MNSSATEISELIVAVFRLNGRLVEAGNQLVKGLGLTSAWWQVLGALAMAPGPLPVSHIARNMGLARQGVQRIADLLAEDGLVRFAPNPHHRRAKLVVLTERGSAVFDQAMQRQRPWALDLASELPPDRIAAALEVIRHLDERLAEAAETANED